MFLKGGFLNIVEKFTLAGSKISPSFLFYIFANRTYVDAKKNRFIPIGNCVFTVSSVKDDKQSAYNVGDLNSVPWLGRPPWRREWQPTLVVLPGELHGQRSLAGYSPWGCRESNMTERLTLKKAHRKKKQNTKASKQKSSSYKS